MLLLLCKSEGAGWFGPPHGTHLPSSANISSLSEAQAYWRQHLGGKTIPLTVHSGGKEFPIKVRFDVGNDHAYTDSRDSSGAKLPFRTFSQKRARALSRLLSVIEHPKRRIISHDSDLLLEGRKDGEYYTIALMWKFSSNVYEFQSAHFKSALDVLQLQQQQGRRKRNGPLQKSEPFCTAFPELEAPYRAGLLPSVPTRAATVAARHHRHDDGGCMDSVCQGLKIIKSSSPTPAQLKAGNYRKEHRRFQGLEISIENPAGSVRSGVDQDGTTWRTQMRYDYGYILGSLGVDKDHVDCYLGPMQDAPTAYIVHQRKAGSWDQFDEDKVMLGFASQQEATRAYLAHYDDPRFLGPVTAMPMDEFKAKIADPGRRGRMLKSLVLFFPMTASRRRP